MANQEISRRSFIKGIAASGVVAGVSALTAGQVFAETAASDASVVDQAAAAAATAAFNAPGACSEREDTCGIKDRTPYEVSDGGKGYMGEAKPSKYITFKQSKETEEKYAKIMADLQANNAGSGPAISGI